MVGHVLQQAGHERIMQVVYSFHMPMLFILSGYFIFNKKSFREFAVSRAVRLLIPYIKCFRNFCCSICMTAVMAGMGNFLQLEAGIINTSILMVSGLGVYVFLLWVLKDDLFMWGVEKLRGKILRC